MQENIISDNLVINCVRLLSESHVLDPDEISLISLYVSQAALVLQKYELTESLEDDLIQF